MRTELGSVAGRVGAIEAERALLVPEYKKFKHDHANFVMTLDKRLSDEIDKVDKRVTDIETTGRVTGKIVGGAWALAGTGVIALVTWLLTSFFGATATPPQPHVSAPTTQVTVKNGEAARH